MHSRRRGFTLLEVLIVTAILGMIASMIAVISPGTAETRQTAFGENLRSFVQSASLYMFENGEYLEDSSSGVVPAGFEDYIDERAWERGTPIGGVWDTELNENGVTSALGVHFMGGGGEDDAFMAEVDAIIDDGDITTGVFQKIANDRFYWIIEE